MRSLMWAVVALLAVAGAARADVISNFTFTNPASGQLDGEGTFSTGAASSQDAGYFLLTGLTFTELRDNQTGTLDTGSLTGTSFQPGSAYNPTTEAFINHAEGSTFNDIGSFSVNGSTVPNNFGSSDVLGISFSQGGVVNSLFVNSQQPEFTGNHLDLLTITTQTSSVPEPSSIALLATGLLGLLGFVCRRSGLS